MENKVPQESLETVVKEAAPVFVDLRDHLVSVD